MLLNVVDAQKIPGVKHPFSLEEALEPVEFGGEVFRFTRLISVEGCMTGVGESIALEGKILAALEGACARCLEPAAFELELPFTESFVRQVDEDESDAFVYEGTQIELDEMVMSVLFTHLPMQILCSEECKGLCSMCGTNLNHQACDCDPALERSAFAQLKKLLYDQEEEV